MNKQEKELFFELCNFNYPSKEILSALLPQNATPAVLGELFFNRMAGIAYGVLKETELLGKVNREFRNALHNAYLQNIEKNESYFKCIDMLQYVLRHEQQKLVMLKGALLCSAYPPGYRTSNDIDLLIHANHISTLSYVLSAAGFKQGHLRNGKFVPATRAEIITSKMTRGETVPYIAEVNLPYMRYVEVDINFSLDYKNDNSETVSKMIQSGTVEAIPKTTIRTLQPSDFFIHLCQHLYKEATTLPWVKMKRDMTLYKFTDINLLLFSMDKKQVNNMFDRAQELGLEKVCATVILWTEALLKRYNPIALERAKEILNGHENMLHEVISPEEKKTYVYQNKDIRARFFAKNRASLLKEV